MSTLSISPAFVQSARPVRFAATAAPSVRLTRRGRAAFLLAFLALALVLMTALGGWAMATRTGGTQPPVHVIDVQQGDTLYGIAGQVASPGKVRQMVHQIEELNSLGSDTLTVGQRIAVPAK